MVIFCVFSLLLVARHENPLEIFPYGDPPPLPTGKLGKLTPPPPWKIQSLPWGVWIFSGTTQYVVLRCPRIFKTFLQCYFNTVALNIRK